jgi:SpoIID/LytB domain protein
LVLALALAAVVGLGPSPASAYPAATVEIDGHGFGHGRGMGQYGALGYALNAGWTSAQILSHFYGNTGTGDIGNPLMTVILSAFSGFDSVVAQERGHMITNAATGTFNALRAVRIGVNTFRVESGPDCGGPWTTVRPSMTGPVVFQPQNRNEDRQEMLQGCEPGGARRWFRGELRAVEGLDATPRTVNALDMQSYLKGVVPREMPASWGDLGGGAGMHALRAQAVAARSYGWAEDRAPYAKTCDTTACQVYGGRAVQTGAGFFDLEDARSNRAVDDTVGQIRTLNGVAARTEYSSSTGGYTAGGTFPAVPDEGDAIPANPFHNWHASVPVSRIQSAYPQLGTLNAVRVTARNGLGDFGGRVREIRLEGSSGNVTLTGDQFRFAFELRSNWYRIADPAPPPPNPWMGPYPIRTDGTVVSGPDAAAVRGSERVDVVVRGTNGFYWTYWSGSGWTGWAGLGSPPGGAVGDPAFVSWSPGRLDVFVRGTDDKLWQRFSENGGANWSGWIKPVGDDGVLASAPEVSSRGPGLLDVFVRGTDGNVYQRYWDGGWSPFWASHGQPPVGTRGEPATASQTIGHSDLFVRGGDDRLWQRSWNAQSGWGSWAQPVGNEGTLASAPEAASWGPGNLLVFVRGTDNGIYTLRYGGGWGGWMRLGGQGDVTENAPGATSRGANRYDLFVRGTDSRVYQIWQ